MTYPITGIKKGLGPAGKVPLRREIDEWWASKEKNDVFQKSLFIYALNEFQQMSPDDQLSYFAIAGIHGQPLVSWDTKAPKNSWYCTHGSPLFPPWHRPYMALYEQRLYEIMLKLIPTTFALEDQPAMIQAAETWRFPFWDWAMRKPDWHFPSDRRRDGPNVPFIITVQTVEVMTKTGVATVSNPMWRFKIPDDPRRKTFGDFGITRDQTLPFNVCKATSRHPTTSNSSNPDFTAAWVNGEKQNWDRITGELRGSRAVDSNTLPEAVYRLFLEEYLPTYNAFSTEGFVKRQPPAQYSSLEDIHGQLHVFTGGSGQMGRVPVAAFDPIFWMHHCNVDRLFAMWQDLYPNKYVQPFISSAGRQIDPNIPLAPFSKDTQGTPWTAGACRDLQVLGYTYPELQKWLDIYKTNGQFDNVKYQKALRTTIELKYSTTGKSTLQLSENQRVATMHLSTIAATNLIVENFPPALVQKAKELQPDEPKIQSILGKDAVTAATVPAPEVKVQASTPKIEPIVPESQPQVTTSTSTQPKEPVEPAAAAKQAPPVAEPHVHAASIIKESVIAPHPHDHPDEKWVENDYIVNVLYDRFALEGYPYTIRIFLGDVPEGPSFYFEDTPTQVGCVYNFSAPAEFRGDGPEGCANCHRQKQDHELSTGQVILTDYLVEHITKSIQDRGLTLQSLSREDVVEYLRKNLHWRISDIDENVILKENMPSLKISVAMGRATHFLAAAVPSHYGDYEVLWEITENRLAGASPGDLD
ncbi:putative tyrosinase [Rhexocercosporidium sp. MPI-PUGE-AT-0058]|nr:putative tyrosinase [Rhexocercosporidium sp. MPI-PUGE-AT-0058]